MDETVFTFRASPQLSVLRVTIHVHMYIIERHSSCSASMLRVSEKSQVEMLVGGLAELLMKVADGDEAVFCMPGTENCFEPTAHYGIDGITEKVIGGRSFGREGATFIWYLDFLR